MAKIFDNKLLWQASFKGVSFEVDDDTLAGGRRIVTHQYPNAESWDNEDLGRTAETISVRGFVYGADVTPKAQALFQACSSPGPGILFLPSRVPALARCMSVNSTFVSDHMGMMLVDMEFVYEKVVRAGFLSTIMLAGALASAAGRAIDAATAQFARDFNVLMRRFSPSGLVPGVGRDAAALTIRLAGAALDDARRKLRFIDRDAAAEAEYLVRQLQSDAVTLAYRGSRGSRMDRTVFSSNQADVQSGLADALVATFEAFSLGAAEPSDLGRVMAGIDAFAPQEITTLIDCRSVRAERALTTEIADLVRRLALLHRGQAVGKIAHGSRAEALGARSDMAAAFATHIDMATDPAVADAFTETRDSVVALLSQRGAELPSTVLVDVGATIPAAVLATALYNDASRDAELVARNRVAHANYMPQRIEAVRP